MKNVNLYDSTEDFAEFEDLKDWLRDRAEHNDQLMTACLEWFQDYTEEEPVDGEWPLVPIAARYKEWCATKGEDPEQDIYIHWWW